MGRRKLFSLRTTLREHDEAEQASPARIDEPVVSITRGSFVYAVCDGCGWEGAGRRSRSSVLLDLKKHAEKCAKGSLTKHIP